MTKERFNLIFAQNVNGNRMGNEYQNASLSLCSSTLYIDIRSPFEISIVSRRAEPCFSIHAQSTLCTYIHTRVYSSSFGVHSRCIPKMHTSADSTERFLLSFFFSFLFFLSSGETVSVRGRRTVLFENAVNEQAFLYSIDRGFFITNFDQIFNRYIYMYFTFEDLFLLYFIIIIRLCNIFYYKRHFSFCTNHEIFGEKVRNDFFFSRF